MATIADQNEISSSDYNAYLKLTKRGPSNKYNARKVSLDGFTFDSKAEAARYQELLILQSQGIIRDLKVHPRYELLPSFKYAEKTVRGISYEADFQYCEGDLLKVEDVKGVATEAFKIKEKLFKNKFPDLLFSRIS